MRAEAIFFALWCLLAPTVFPGTERSPHELYDAIKALRVDSSNVYRIAPAHHVQLRRGDAVLSFEEGTLTFFSPLDGQITGAVFSGRGHVLAAPREPVEKQQMGRFLGAPVLDQEFSNAYVRFTDDTAGELLRQFRAANLVAQTDASVRTQWDSAVTHLNPSYTLRILFDRLSPNPKPCFYAGLEGAATGPFDVVLDAQRDEQFLLGQVKKAGGTTLYDVWTSHRVPDSPVFPVAFRALHYSMETSISPNNSLDATASVRLRAETGTERVLVFQLSRALTIDSVTGEHGEPLPFFQNEGMNLQERSARGNDYLDVILPQTPSGGQEFTLHFHYRGNVIQDAGNGVLFVGARESWYPHLGDSAEFSAYDFLLRWPHKLRLIATGSKLEEHEDGEFRVGHWKTEKPMSVAGFNLGEYASASVASGARSIDVYANRQLEEDLRKRLTLHDADTLSLPSGRFGSASTAHSVVPPAPSPSPADALKQLGKEIDSSIRFYETFSGPFPFHNLSVSQIPGTFGQGWPGLLYVSTYSFLPSEAQQRAGLSTASQEHFSELVPYHEVAHQWWGNVVAWSSYRDQWIDEAIANYLAVLFADTKKNPDHTLHVWLARYRQQLVEKLPGATETAGDIGALALGSRLNSSKSPTAYEQIIYSKGSWIIHMLREMLRQPGARNPDARFTALLQTLVTKYAYRALSTDDLQHEVEAVMTPGMNLEGGRSMEWFFEEWVRGTGIPHYRLEFTAHHTEKGYQIRGNLFQTGVPRSFVASVPLYAGGAGHGAFLVTVVAAGPETSFQFVAPSLPRKIVVDPQMTLLCTSE
ncbi:MAG TPA: M1 family aminopeptidase [Candidatus Dormibacteraeota bacterium]|nr:M1 family aminopeptidase [Candidatus Dormibacteraeota bacterium]